MLPVSLVGSFSLTHSAHSRNTFRPSAKIYVNPDGVLIFLFPARSG